jgi:hypothetical protein
LYNRLTDPLLILVFQGRSIPEAHFNGTATTVPFVRVSDGFEVLPHSHSLCPLLLEVIESGDSLHGTFVRVRVISSKRGQRKLLVLFFFGSISDLQVDTGRIL